MDDAAARAEQREELVTGVLSNPELREALVTRLLAELESARAVSTEAKDAAAIAAKLQERLEQFQNKAAFRPGMLVEWKPRLRNKNRPAYGEPAVVVEVLSQPVTGQTDESGSPYFREPLDIIAAIIDPNDDRFDLYYFDSRRFQPFDRAS
jgi:hypothetical protein